MASNTDSGLSGAKESLLTRMSNSIGMHEKLCTEEKYLKKKWYVRNGQDCAKTGNFEKPVIYLLVEEKSKRHLQFGLVIQAALTTFSTGKGKKKQVNEGLCFLCLYDGGFVSFILDFGNYDHEMTLGLTEDMVAKEFLAVIEKGEWN